MDRFEVMSILVLTAEKGSFTAAARALGMPLPTLSRKVSEFEAHLGTRLLLRSTRRLALTDAGSAYVAAARRILEQVEEAERIAVGEYSAPRGELVLTAPVLFGRLHVLPIVTDFLAAYPEINVRLLLSDRNLQLVEDHVDLGVRIGALPDSSLIATRVGAMRTVVCAAPALLARHGEPRRPEALTALPCVSFDLGDPPASWSFRDPSAGATSDVRVRPRLVTSTAETAVAAAVGGTGFTRVLAYQCAEAVGAGDLRPVLSDFEVELQPVHLIHAPRGALPLKMRVFLDFTADRLRRSLADGDGLSVG